MERLTTKEIAKEIRDNLKKKYPNLKFSVTKESFSGGSHIYVALMEGNFMPFLDDKRKYSDLNVYYISESSKITDETKLLMLEVKDIVTNRHYNNSDSQVDYFDTNFYYSIGIGKWNKPYLKY